MGLIDINDICEKSRRQRAVALRNGSISGAMDVKLGRLSAFGRKGGIF